MEEAFGFLKANSNAQESIQILKGLLHGGYPDAWKGYSDRSLCYLNTRREYPDACNSKSRIATNKYKKARNKCFKSQFNAITNSNEQIQKNLKQRL